MLLQEKKKFNSITCKMHFLLAASLLFHLCTEQHIIKEFKNINRESLPSLLSTFLRLTKGVSRCELNQPVAVGKPWD